MNTLAPPPGRHRPRLAALGRPARALIAAAGLACGVWIAAQVAGHRGTWGILIWFGTSIIGHDLILFPLYAVADLALITVLSRNVVRRHLPVCPLNHVRVPTLGAALLFCVYFPGIVSQWTHTYHAVTGQTQQPFLGRWVLAVAAMYALSGIVYTVQALHARHRLDAHEDARSTGSGGHVPHSGR